MRQGRLLHERPAIEGLSAQIPIPSTASPRPALVARIVRFWTRRKRWIASPWFQVASRPGAVRASQYHREDLSQSRGPIEEKR